MDFVVPIYTKNYKRFSTKLLKNFIHQKFTLPENIVYYLSKNASPFVYQKLIKSCKYFLTKSSVVIAESLDTFSENFNIELEENFAKIWIIEEMLSIDIPNAFDYVFPKLGYVNVKKLNFWHQNLFYNELLFLIMAGKVENFYFYNSSIKYSNGNWVELAEILEKLPLIRKFEYNKVDSQVFTIETAEKMAESLFFPNLMSMCIGKDIPIDFLKSQHFLKFKKNHPFAEFGDYL